MIKVREDTIKNWIKKGVIDAIVMDNQYYLRKVSVEKARKIAGLKISERMKNESHQQHIPYLYRLCASGKFEEVAKELEISNTPKTCAECYSIVGHTRKQKALYSEKEKI